MNRQRFKFGWTAVMLVAAAAIIGITADRVDAQQKPAGAGSPNERIAISADNLTVNNQSRVAEFSGNVKAQQGDTVIRSDFLRIHYKKDLGDKQKQASGEDVIEKIVATGNVKIKFEDRVAVSDEAVYIAETRVLVLSGSQARIISGNDSVSGSKITLHRNDGSINIEGGKENRVEAIFYPGGKGGLQ